MIKKYAIEKYFLLLTCFTFTVSGCLNPHPPLFRSIDNDPIPYGEQYIKASVEFLDAGSPVIIDSVTLPMSDSIKFKLQKNYSNPFSPSTSFEFYVPSYDSVQLSVYDGYGIAIGELFNDCLTKGHYKLVVGNSHVNSGAYFLRSIIAHTTSIKKFVLIK